MEDRDTPATKGDIVDLKGEIVDVNERLELLRSEVNHGYRELVERMDDGFTRLLNAFYSVA